MRIAFLVLLLTGALTRAEDAAQAKWTVVVECKMVTLPQASAMPLVTMFHDPARANEAWELLSTKIESGEATLTADLPLRGSSETRLTSDTLEEFRYATEFEPAQLPERLSKEDSIGLIGAWPVIGQTPTAFEVRNIGQHLMLEVSVSENGGEIDLNIEAQDTRLLRMKKIEYGELPDGRRLSLDYPTFYTARSTISVAARNGGAVLFGVHKLEMAEPTFELFVLHVRAVRADSVRE